MSLALMPEASSGGPRLMIALLRLWSQKSSAWGESGSWAKGQLSRMLSMVRPLRPSGWAAERARYVSAFVAVVKPGAAIVDESPAA
ncbi:unnamed protein product [Ectocarpus sp. 12 AP-2014]